MDGDFGYRMASMENVPVRLNLQATFDGYVGVPRRGRTPRPLEDRFWEKVRGDSPDECWEWTASTTGTGYGQLMFPDRRLRKAHRIAYELVIGVIPPGLTLDHLCRNRKCVNPAHLEPVTHRENILRGEGLGATKARQTHCKRGHPLSGDNLYVPPKRPRQRHCRACADALKRKSRDGS